jgi:hypothetical protein
MNETFRNMGCNMSLKLHFLHSHLGFNLATLQMSVMSMIRHFTIMEKCYQGKWSPSNAWRLMLATEKKNSSSIQEESKCKKFS